MDEQELKKYDEIMARMDQGMSEYQAINYNTLPQNPVPFKQYVSYVNTQNEIETEHKLAKSFYNGTISMINGLIGTGRMLADRRLSYEAQEGEAAGMTGVGSVTIDELRKPTKLLQLYNVQANTTAEKLIYGLAEGGAQLAGQALVTLATGGIGGGIFMGAQIAGNQYNELRKEGVDPDRAFKASVTNALIQTPLEQLAFGKIMKALPANSKLKAKLYKVAEDFITEGVTEGLQSLPEQLTNIWAKNNGIDALGVAREWDKNASDNIKDMVYSGIIGSILGAGAGGIRIGISTAIEKSFTNYQNKNIEANAENAKKNGMSAQQTQQSVDLYDRGETAVNIDAQQVLSYAQSQQVDVEKVATSLGVTASEIEDAAEAGLDITVSKGHMVQAMMEQNGFSEAIIPHISYGEQGHSLNYYQMQEEVSKAYGEGSEAVKALDEELNAIEQSMLDAGVPKDQAKQARELYNAFAVSMSPENPAEWIKNHKVRFANEGKVSKKDSLFQTAPNVESQEFKNWFGNSTIVDDEGNPLVLYRGISEKYNVDKQPNVVWLSPDKAQSDRYRYGGSGSEVLYVYAKVENPFFVGDSYTQMTVSNFVNKIMSTIDTAYEEGRITEQRALALYDELENIQRNDDGKYFSVYQIYNSRQDLVDIIKELGFDAISTTEDGNLTYGVFGQENVKAVNNQGTFNPNDANIYNQAQEGKYKGTFSPQADGSFVINMLKGHDASTVIHETGHYFFEIFMQESGLDTASDKLKKDRAAFLNYVGMTEEQWQAADFDGRRAAHERVATAFEQYLLEGKAPSKGLRGVFSRFSKWLKTIYGNVVNSKDYAELTDDVRQVFDHWLAADADLEEAAKMQGFYGKLDSKLTANLSPEKKKWLEDKIYNARQTAIDMLTKKYMENFRPERRAEIEAFRKANEEAVRERVHNYRVNEAKRSLIDIFTQDIERPLKYGLLVDFPIMQKFQVAGKPIQLSNRYLNWLNYDRGREEQYKSIQSEIDAALNPIIEKLNEGFGARSRVAYIDTATGQEISFDEAQSRDKASPGYVTRFVSENDPWYQKWWAENHRRPTKAEILELAEDLYCGIDEYGVYGDLMTAHSAEQQDYLDQYVKEQRAQLNEWYAERDRLQNDDKYLGKEKRPKLTDDQAIFYEELAEYFGYSSGSEMANDIINAKSESVMVRDELNALVKEKYPSYAEDKAKAELAIVESLNNDKEGEVIALEQQLIDEAAQTAFEREQTTQARMALAREQKAKAEVTARNTLLNMPIIEALNIRRFAMAERRAAASAKKAIKAGDFEAASEFKRQQMVAHAMVRYSAKLKQEVERTKKFVKRLRKLKKDKEHFGNEQNFNQIAHLLYRLGVERKDYNPSNRTQTLADYLAEMTDKLGDGVPDIDESVTNEMNDLRDSQNMTIEQYSKIRDALQNLYAIVKQDIQGTLDAKAKDFAENKENITENLNKLDDKYTPSIGGVDSESFWARQIAQRQSLDNFLEMMDGWTLGYFSKTFGAPLKHAADLQAKLTMEFEDAISAAMKKWLPNAEARRAADTERYYEELGGNANKHTLVNMLIHLGNQSSMERLCTTRVEGAENSKLWVFPDANNNLSREEAIAMTRENLINFLGKHLTSADVEFAQAKVDAANKLWPLLAQVNIDTKGFAPAKVEATPVAFKPSNGDYMTFRGGYYPLARDSRLGSQRQGAEAFSSTEDGSAPIKTMSTVQSTSKSRTGANYPVKLNYGYEMGIIQDTIHDIAYRQVMMNFNKIFSDKEIASLMKRKLGLENYNVLKETLWKCARPRSGQDMVMAERDFLKIADWIRRKTINAVIACNIKISLQNLGNVFLFGNTVEGFTHADVLVAMRNIFTNPKQFAVLNGQVMEKSTFMRERAKAPDFALRQVMEENVLIKTDKIANGKVKAGANKVKDSAEWLEGKFLEWGAKLLTTTDNLTAVPVWWQAYTKKIQAGASEQEAVDFADTVIRRTLGSTRIQDVASVQRGSGFYKLFNAFQGFFNTQFNQWYREYKIDKKLFSEKEYKEAFTRVVQFALSKWLIACLANTIIGSLSFIKPFEKDEKKKWRDITQELITYPLVVAGGPTGQAAMAMIQPALGMQSYGYRLSIIENTLTKGTSLAYSIYSVGSGKKDASELAEPVLEIASIALGIPLQIVRSGGNFVDWLRNDMNFELEDIMNRRRKSERNK